MKEIIQRSIKKTLHGEDILGKDRLTLLLLDVRVSGQKCRQLEEVTPQAYPSKMASLHHILRLWWKVFRGSSEKQDLEIEQ